MAALVVHVLYIERDDHFQHGHGDYVSGLGCEPAYMNSSMLINNQLVKNPFEGRQGPIL